MPWNPEGSLGAQLPVSSRGLSQRVRWSGLWCLGRNHLGRNIRRWLFAGRSAIPSSPWTGNPRRPSNRGLHRGPIGPNLAKKYSSRASPGSQRGVCRKKSLFKESCTIYPGPLRIVHPILAWWHHQNHTKEGSVTWLLTILRWKSDVMSIFCGFKSLWIIPRPWRYSSVCTISAV